MCDIPWNKKKRNDLENELLTYSIVAMKKLPIWFVCPLSLYLNKFSSTTKVKCKWYLNAVIPVRSCVFNVCVYVLFNKFD